MDKVLANPGESAQNLSDGSFYKRYEDLKQQLAEEMDRWELLHIELEDMK